MVTVLLGGQTDPNGLLDALLNGSNNENRRIKETAYRQDSKNGYKTLLEEAFRLLRLETEDVEVYKLSEDQKNAVNEARQQIKNGQFLTDDEANKDINEWLRNSEE